ncbi:MAG: ATP-binding cassette domain-containing protein [Sciscionella sp.]
MFAWVNGLFAQGRASAARIAEVLAAPAAVTAGNGALPTPTRGALRVRELSHGTLRKVSFDVAAGELVGVVAGDPADAAALLRCFGRDADPDGGAVELDGVCLPTVDISAARRAVLVAAHDSDLFEGTLLDNVRAGSAADDDLTAALAAADAHEVAAALPQGGATVLTERGRSLSGGQRQRVALARALAAAAPVLVVHDPTTAVDAVTEAAVATGIQRLRSGRTTIVVTTSPVLLAVTDRVLVLTGGTVTAKGSHSDLLHGHDSYPDLGAPHPARAAGVRP